MNTPIISFSSNSDMNFYSSRFFIPIIVLALMLVSHITIGRTTSSTTLKANEILNIALDCGTDKVTAHHYDLAYSKYLPSLRMKPVSMLEIGLGCNMQYGPGKSLELWTRYFPHKNAKINFMEYDKSCSEKFESTLESRARIFAGDQSNTDDLARMIENFGIPEYDFIIDDGGHTMVQQITSLTFLFKFVKPGGMYFLEDLQTSYMEGYGGGYKREGTAIEFIKTLIDEFYSPSMNRDFISMIESIDCYHEVCVFTKKSEVRK